MAILTRAALADTKHNCFEVGCFPPQENIPRLIAQKNTNNQWKHTVFAELLTGIMVKIRVSLENTQ